MTLRTGYRFLPIPRSLFSLHPLPTWLASRPRSLPRLLLGEIALKAPYWIRNRWATSPSSYLLFPFGDENNLGIWT